MISLAEQHCKTNIAMNRRIVVTQGSAVVYDRLIQSVPLSAQLSYGSHQPPRSHLVSPVKIISPWHQRTSTCKSPKTKWPPLCPCTHTFLCQILMHWEKYSNKWLFIRVAVTFSVLPQLLKLFMHLNRRTFKYTSFTMWKVSIIGCRGSTQEGGKYHWKFNINYQT